VYRIFFFNKYCLQINWSNQKLCSSHTVKRTGTNLIVFLRTYIFVRSDAFLMHKNYEQVRLGTLSTRTLNTGVRVSYYSWSITLQSFYDVPSITVIFFYHGYQLCISLGVIILALAINYR